MEAWKNLWHPAAVLGVAGTAGVIACLWPAARRWIAPWCALAWLAAALSWDESSNGDSGNDLVRATFTVSLGWGVLLTVAQWPMRFRKFNDELQSGGAVNSPGTPHPEFSTAITLPVQLILFSGLCWMALASDLVTLFLGLQLTLVGARIFADAGFNKLSSLDPRFPLPWLLLLGFLLLVAVTGSTHIETISEVLKTSYGNRESARHAIAGGGSRLLTLSVVLIGTALAGYATCAPLHFQFVSWARREASVSDRSRLNPQASPTMLLLPRAAALAVWIKLWPRTTTGSEGTAQLLVGVLAAVTIVVTLLQARVEGSLVKQWILLSMAQAGWLLLAVASHSFEHKTSREDNGWPIIEWNLPTAAQAAWQLLLIDGVAVIGLFGVLDYLRREDRAIEFVDDLRGLLHREPVAAICASVCLLSLSGMPLLAGFWSRLFVALVAMNVRGEWGPPHLLVPHSGLLVLTALLALGSVWSTSIAFRSVWAMIFGLPLGKPRPVGAASSLFAAVLASVILIGCGVLPGPLLSWLCAPRTQMPDMHQPQKVQSAEVRGAIR